LILAQSPVITLSNHITYLDHSKTTIQTPLTLSLSSLGGAVATNLSSAGPTTFKPLSDKPQANSYILSFKEGRQLDTFQLAQFQSLVEELDIP
jgi:hypothetical protein